ncbi:MAG: indole-3-glycerol phosphate synthase TrpC [bacterium]
MMGILEKIIKAKEEEVELLKKVPFSPPHCYLARREFKAALLSEEIALIGELKKCSPSAGMIREDFHPESLAMEMEEGGAKAISVLTDSKFFCGSLRYLPIVKMRTGLPVLMKDFVIDEFQIELASQMGADAILLIARCLSRDKLAEFLNIAKGKGLDCLVEIFDENDWEKIKELPVEIVGINSRDLRNFQVSFERIQNLRRLLPEEVLIVAESGIKERRQIEELRRVGIRAFLVGEALMKARDIKAKIRELLGDVEG